VDLDQRGDHLAPGTVLVVDEASMVGTRDLARLAAHVQRVGGSIKLIGDPDQHTSVETGGIFKALAARDDPSIVRLVENRRQTDSAERAAIDYYRRGQIGAALDHYDSGGKIVRAATAAATYDVLVRDWWSDRRAGSTSSMLAGTNAARRALNDRARSLLKKEGVLSGHPLVVHRREFMIGDEVVARRNDRALRCPGRSEFVKNGSTGRVTGIDHAGRQVDVAFANEGTIRIPSDYLDAGHLDHAYARTTFGVQGTTLDRARYHPADASRFEEGYVAITRATEITNLYVVEGEVEVDDEVDSRAVQRPETGLAVVANALTRRSDDKLAVASDPRAIDAGRLAKEYSLCQLREHRQEVEALLQLQPPSVAGELAEARGRAEGLKARQAVVADQLASWSPKRHRNAARQMASLQAAIINAEARIAELETAQERHEDFAVEHADEFAQHDLLRRAEGARRLQVRIAAVADPPPAIAAALGPRPATQRDRLRWDRAAEAVAVYLDENDRQPPDVPCSIAELLGPRPQHSLDGYGYDMVIRAIRQQSAPERERGARIALS
ncbi:MAG: AAA family ATPase, partial [Actinobacteria bacterium]|nr:AAA family ATPase [Actinomycetota bacterium]